MVLCCFRGKLAANELPPTVGNEGALVNAAGNPETVDTNHEACASQSLRQEQLKTGAMVSALRCQLATVQGSWLSRVQSCVECVQGAFGPAAQVSLFGASSCGTALVSLGSTSLVAPAAVLAPGHVMPAPWLDGGGGDTTAAAAAANSASEALLILGPLLAGGGVSIRTDVPGVQLWQDPPPEPKPRRPFEAPQNPSVPPDQDRTRAPPEEWRQLLRALAAEQLAAVGVGLTDVAAVERVSASPPPLPPPIRATLLPLRLGSDVIGALLLVSPPELRAELLGGVAAAVAECCIGPQLADIQRVTTAAYDMACAPDVQGLASTLSSAVTEALASELHVDFAVRFALVPQVPGARPVPQYGFLLTEQHAQQQAHLAVLTGTAMASDLLSGASTSSPASRGAARSLSLQCSNTESYRAMAVPAAKLAAAAMSGMFCSGALASHQHQPPALSGVHSFQLPSAFTPRCCAGVAARVWKARPFSLESTLLASLAGKAARAYNLGGGGAIGSGVGFAALCTAAASNAVHGAFEDGGAAGNNQSGGLCMRFQSPAVGSPSFALGSALVGTAGGVGGVGGCSGSGFRICRLAGTVVPHVHAYVNDTDQPSGDVVLLLRTAAPVATVHATGGRGTHGGFVAAAAGGGGAVAGGGPASLVLVMGCVTLPAGDLNRGGCGAAAAAVDLVNEDAATSSARPPTRSRTGNLNGSQSGMMAPSTPSAVWPSAGGAAGGGGSDGDVSVCVALYLTSQERLPTSLLSAARNRAQVLLELLLPGAAACLSDAASAELQYLCDSVSGPAAAAASTQVGRAFSIPMTRLQPRSPWSPSGLPTEEHGTHMTPSGAAAAPLGSVDASSAIATGAAGGGLLSLSSATAAAVQAPGAAAGVGVGLSVSLRMPSPRDRSTAYSGSLRGSQEVVDGEGAALVHLLGSRTINTNTGESVTVGVVGQGAAAQPVWAMATLPVASGPATRDASETCPRVPRSRLSHATATQVPGAGGLTGTAVANVIMSSYNSLVAPLMGSISVTGKGSSGIGGAGGVGGAGAIGDPLTSGGDPIHRSSSNVTPPTSQMSNIQRRLHNQRPSLTPPGSASGSRDARMHVPPQRQVSELLATMPWDVSDTLTVMRTNMDILVSSFWNTLRSYNTEAAPSPHADEDLRFLQLIKVLGGGGCSTVYSGLLHGLEVAVKVMKAPSAEDDEEAAEAARQQQQQPPPADGDLTSPPPAARQAQFRAIMRGARELAVMTSISHPNIVQIYSYHTRVLVQTESDESDRGSALEAPVLPRLLPLLVGVTPPGPVQTVLIMECCDLGSLADALDSGMFSTAVRNADTARWRTPLGSHTFSQLPAVPAEGGPSWGAGGSALRNVTSRAAAAGGSMRAIYLTLLEVALALRHMHSMQLVHCDVKPANVLLKSSASDPRGFTCKLTDFGFVNLLQLHVEDADDPLARPTMRYHEPVGTVTHLAPETMVQGSKLDHTVDVFAFGILMWEAYTGKAPYAEHATTNFQDVPYRVVREGMRPVFPTSTPAAFKSLAQACWSADTARRPTAAVLVASLQRLMDAAARG